ncbi:hypothetical protein ACFHWD_16980 [Clostridium sp. MT-14]|uniref:hypothetical protein n=1 Tax=Clostridium sp. MT-14 TaxID=3348360 RepID=UPI0035F308FA
MSKYGQIMNILLQLKKNERGNIMGFLMFIGFIGVVVAIIFLIKGVIKKDKSKSKRNLVILAVSFVVFIVGASNLPDTGNTTKNTNTANTANTDSSSTDTEETATKETTPAPKPVEESKRVVAGTATDLSTGTFTGGKDVQAGLYDATPVEGQGNFTVNGSDGSLKINEILGAANGMGVSKVRVEIADGDKIQLQGINKAHFEPVTTPFVTKAQQLSLYSGVWKAGEDIAVGRYKAVPASGSGNFVVYDKSGMPKVNEILGGSAGGVNEVTFDVEEGDIVNIAGMSQANITPAN